MDVNSEVLVCTIDYLQLGIVRWLQWLVYAISQNIGNNDKVSTHARMQN